MTSKEIERIKNNIKNIERLILKTKNINEKNKLEKELKKNLDTLHILKKNERYEKIKNKYLSSNGDVKTVNTEKIINVTDKNNKDVNILTIIEEYINNISKIKKDDIITLKDGRKGYVIDLFYNSMLMKQGKSGIMVTLKRLTKKGKKHHLWLSKYGVPIEEIKDAI